MRDHHHRTLPVLTLAALLGVLALLAGAGPAAAATGDPVRAATETDALVFATPLPEFVALRDAALAGRSPADPSLDWSSDDCSVPLVAEPSRSQPHRFDFRDACRRHDFGYRNLKAQGRFTEDVRHRVDDVFRADLDGVCATYAGRQAYRGVECRQIAADYYFWVRSCGASPAPYCPLVARGVISRFLDR